MSRPKVRANNVVTFTSSLTFLDLIECNYNDFTEELELMHGQMQSVATNNTADTYTRFDVLFWWYCISQGPSSYEHASSLWYPLNGPGAYQTMLDKIVNVLDSVDTTLQLTNASRNVRWDASMLMCYAEFGIH